MLLRRIKTHTKDTWQIILNKKRHHVILSCTARKIVAKYNL